MDRMRRCLDVLEAEGGEGFGPNEGLGAVAAAVALSYADFRYPDLGWREGRPRLAAYYAAYDKRPSMQATRLYE